MGPLGRRIEQASSSTLIKDDSRLTTRARARDSATRGARRACRAEPAAMRRPSRVAREPDSAELPARGRWKEIAIRRADVRARRRTSHRAARTGCMNLPLYSPMPPAGRKPMLRMRSGSIPRRRRRVAPAENYRGVRTRAQSGVLGNRPSTATVAAANSHSASVGNRAPAQRVGIGLEQADVAHRRGASERQHALQRELASAAAAVLPYSRRRDAICVDPVPALG